MLVPGFKNGIPYKAFPTVILAFGWLQSISGLLNNKVEGFQIFKYHMKTKLMIYGGFQRATSHSRDFSAVSKSILF